MIECRCFRNFLLLAGAGLCCTGVTHMIGAAAVRICESLCNALTDIVGIVYDSEKQLHKGVVALVEAATIISFYIYVSIVALAIDEISCKC